MILSAVGLPMSKRLIYISQENKNFGFQLCLLQWLRLRHHSCLLVTNFFASLYCAAQVHCDDSQERAGEEAGR
jgi:hypothetical protein